ncbi:MAG: hypothetical protein K2X43_09505 [Hyphomonadaceae bacterium]|jgi:uncharacterized coiled-coil protein SlyX|nr:hypothetical protein [Hyphomonadaceae bacterium]
MKKKEVDKAHRILAAEQQLHRIEQWRQAELESRLAELEATQVELIGALNDTNALHGLFIDATARRLSSIAEQAERVGREKEAQALKLKEHAARVKVCERLALEHEQEFAREKEGKELLDIVEQFVGRGRTSLP